MSWHRIGRPGPIGSRKKEIETNYNALYGEDGWRIIWENDNNILKLEDALVLYEDAYYEYFKNNRGELNSIAQNYSEVYDNNISNIKSGTDYSIQEFEGNHFQDIAIRNVMKRFGLSFSGPRPLEVREREPGVRYNPGKIDYHQPQNIITPVFPITWAHSKSIESFYQSNKFLEVQQPREQADVYFVTGNKGKFANAQKKLPANIDMKQLNTAYILENQDNITAIAIHKAKVAYSILCQPVMCDDSGFYIEVENNYPGHLVNRVLSNKDKQIQHFHDIANKHGGSVDAYFKSIVAYYDGTTANPIIFSNSSHGTLINETRGDLSKAHVKSDLFGSFIPQGETLTLAEMNDAEFVDKTRSSKWDTINELLQHKKNYNTNLFF